MNTPYNRKNVRQRTEQRIAEEAAWKMVEQSGGKDESHRQYIETYIGWKVDEDILPQEDADILIARLHE